MAKKKVSEETQATTEQVLEFFSNNPEAMEHIFSAENLVHYIEQSGAWPEFSEMLDKVREFSDLENKDLAQYIYVGAYTKFKQLGSTAERLMNEEYLKESGNRPELTREEVFARMNGSSRQRGIVEAGTLGKLFAATKTPKV